MAPKILLIIPAYNEEASIEKTLQPIIDSPYDYIVINDGSTDNTATILDKNHYNHIDLISNLGIGGAVQTGYKYAKSNNYDIAIQVDADGQHDISYVQDLIAPILKKQANLTIGSSFINKRSRHQRSSKLRRIGIRFLSGIIKLFSGKRLHDPTSGFRATDRDIIAIFAAEYPTEYPEAITDYELLKNSTFRIKEVPVRMRRRSGGRSSIRSWKTLYAGFNVLLSIIILSLRSKHD